jgi:hypothetical protein
MQRFEVHCLGSQKDDLLLGWSQYEDGGNLSKMKHGETIIIDLHESNPGRSLHANP